MLDMTSTVLDEQILMREGVIVHITWGKPSPGWVHTLVLYQGRLYNIETDPEGEVEIKDITY